jgi:hypothetical protein
MSLVKVEVQDANGSTVTDATTSITMSIGTNPATDRLSGTKVVAAVNGVAIFSDLEIDAAGNGYTLQTASAGFDPIISSDFDVLTLSGVTPPSGLVGWWPGDGNANDIVGVNNGTWQGSATFTAGLVDQGFDLNGVDQSVSAALSVSGPFTVEFWAKAGSTGQAEFTSVFSSKNASTGTTLEGSFQIELDGSGQYRLDAGNADLFLSIGAASSAEFQHIAVTYDGSTVSTYLDGAIRSSGAWLPATPGPLGIDLVKIGVNRSGNLAFAGVVDEVSVYNRALSTVEIQGIFASGSAGKDKSS